MSSPDFPEIPSTEELLREANELNENSEQYNQVEPFRANPPYMLDKSDWPVAEHKEAERMAEIRKTYADIPLEQRRRPIFDIEHAAGHVVALSPLVKAYARFTSEQTMFLENGAAMTGEQYQQALWRYSKEQTTLIRAQAEALRQAGVL